MYVVKIECSGSIAMTAQTPLTSVFTYMETITCEVEVNPLTSTESESIS